MPEAAATAVVSSITVVRSTSSGVLSLTILLAAPVVVLMMATPYRLRPAPLLTILHPAGVEASTSVAAARPAFSIVPSTVTPLPQKEAIFTIPALQLQ